MPGTGEGEESAQPAAGEGPPPELEEVIDTAAAPVQGNKPQNPGQH